MSENSAIQWTDNTFNPWIGCAHVSPGCENCYAEVNTFTRAQRAKGRELWGATGDRHPISEAKWREVQRWHDKAAEEGRRVKVFCASLADVFEDRRDLDPLRERLFRLIEGTPHLIWQLLTKRPENAAKLAPPDWTEDGYPANVWMGTTVEDRKRRDRLDVLRSIPCAILFASFEPLLEHLGDVNLRGIAWAIFGGESARPGQTARSLDVRWVRDGVEQCRKFDTAPFVKQLGALPFQSPGVDGGTGFYFDFKDSHGGDWLEWPADLRVREFPR